MGWSDIPTELLIEITKKLDLVDVIQSGAVCSWWSSIPCKDKYALPDSQVVPWLMMSSRRKPNSRFFYSLTEKKTYEFNLPDIAGQHCVGSCHGYLLSIDDQSDLIATNPITRGPNIPLPPMSSFDYVKDVRRDSSGHITEYFTNGMFRKTRVFIEDFFYKAILSPDKKFVVVIDAVIDRYISFACVGEGQSWTTLETHRDCADMIFHKGRLHVMDVDGTLFVFDLSPLPEPSSGCSLQPSFESPIGPIDEDLINRSYLVESPNGEDLFLVARVLEYRPDKRDHRTRKFKVYLLDKDTYTSKRIKTLGELSFFVGFNYSKSLRATDFPGLMKNCIYFTDDYKESYIRKPRKVGDHGIYSFEDKSVKPYYEDKDGELEKLNWPPPVWYMPAIL